MKKTLLSALLILTINLFTLSQNVGINPTGALPDGSAILDVSSTDKGLLVPRVTLTGTSDVTTIPSAAPSLLIYNTSVTADVTPGYYYWSGSAWIRLATFAGWETTGNTGTVAGTNFIGTTDAVDFVAKTNNLERMRINTSGYVGINTINPIAYLHIITQPGVQALRLENSISVGIFLKNQTQPLNSKNWIINNSGSLLAFGAMNDAESTVYNPLVIHRNGFIGINTPSPTTRLEIRGTSSKGFTFPQNILKLTSDDATNPLSLNHGLIGDAVATNRYAFIDVDDAGVRRNLILQTTSGNVGIGTTSPGGQFELSLDEGRKPGTTAWTIPSDERLKIIHGTYYKGLNEIIKLNPITYQYKNREGRTFDDELLKTKFAGFSAQEVQKIFPEAVKEDADGYLNFNIHPITIAYANAIKELNTKNKELEERLRILEKIVLELSQKSTK